MDNYYAEIITLLAITILILVDSAFGSDIRDYVAYSLIIFELSVVRCNQKDN